MTTLGRSSRHRSYNKIDPEIMELFRKEVGDNLIKGNEVQNRAAKATLQQCTTREDLRRCFSAFFSCDDIFAAICTIRHLQKLNAMQHPVKPYTKAPGFLNFDQVSTLLCRLLRDGGCPCRGDDDEGFLNEPLHRPDATITIDDLLLIEKKADLQKKPAVQTQAEIEKESSSAPVRHKKSLQLTSNNDFGHQMRFAERNDDASQAKVTKLSHRKRKYKRTSRNKCPSKQSKQQQMTSDHQYALQLQKKYDKESKQQRKQENIQGKSLTSASPSEQQGGIKMPFNLDEFPFICIQLPSEEDKNDIQYHIIVVESWTWNTTTGKFFISWFCQEKNLKRKDDWNGTSTLFSLDENVYLEAQERQQNREETIFSPLSTFTCDDFMKSWNDVPCTPSSDAWNMNEEEVNSLELGGLDDLDEFFEQCRNDHECSPSY